MSQGSPPPMRGKAHGSRVRPHRAGITPAYAGKRRQSVQTKQKLKDHPRLCGEKSACMRVSLQWIGSPPPMRGKANFVGAPPSRLGITPAYAGKRVNTIYFYTLIRDHPRLCGEKSGLSAILASK